ncbi:hypothetical protein QCA50_015443 [Cerrena zonata]|uniref:T6SS Phospholipase effector Tle1-like catalytic domain-containing protein n=1 Tax=Cerrena zonata TaxID=2478898 RepID=A0AAW0FMF9_9APHY
MPESDHNTISNTTTSESNIITLNTTTPKGRTLVLCFDGTSDQYDRDNTNVVRFYELLKKDDENEQLCYYQPGIGTYFQPGVVSPLVEWSVKVMDEAVAW